MFDSITILSITVLNMLGQPMPNVQVNLHYDFFDHIRSQRVEDTLHRLCPPSKEYTTIVGNLLEYHKTNEKGELALCMFTSSLRSIQRIYFSGYDKTQHCHFEEVLYISDSSGVSYSSGSSKILFRITSIKKKVKVILTIHDDSVRSYRHVRSLESAFNVSFDWYNVGPLRKLLNYHIVNAPFDRKRKKTTFIFSGYSRGCAMEIDSQLIPVTAAVVLRLNGRKQLYYSTRNFVSNSRTDTKENHRYRVQRTGKVLIQIPFPHLKGLRRIRPIRRIRVDVYKKGEIGTDCLSPKLY